MPTKRTRSASLDLTQEDSDEDYEPTPRTTRSSRSKRTSPPTSPSRPSPPSPTHGDVVNRMIAASTSLGPRGRIWGGQGLISQEKYEAPKKHLDLKDEAQRVAFAKEEKKKKPKDGGQTFLFFPVERGANDISPEPQELEFDEAQVLYTTYKKRKGTGKKKNDDGFDSSDSSDDDNDKVDLNTIVGTPEEIQQAIICSPNIQVPWICNTFGTLPDPNRRPRSPSKKKSKKSLDDEEEAKKKAKSKPSKPKRTFKDNASLLLLHDRSLPKDGPVFKRVFEHGAKGFDDGVSNARFFYMVYCHAKTKRLRLRIAITTASADYENWTTTENAVWIQEFPALDNPTPKNSTHTTFSSQLFKFMAGSLEVPKSSDYANFIDSHRFFDFSSSSSVQPVFSNKGTWNGDDGLALGGGLISLAQAIDAFKPSAGGIWKVEYITPVCRPVTRRFLKRLYNAAQGISPIEADAGVSKRAKRAAESFKLDRIKLAYPTVETVESWKHEKMGRYSLVFETLDDVDFDKILASDIRSHFNQQEKVYSVMHDVKLKSGRINHSSMMVIFHTPSNKAKELPNPYEAFVLIGSHTPTLDSWGKFEMVSNEEPKSTIKNNEFSVLTKLSEPSWKELVDAVNDFVSYKRPLRPYEKGDFPFPTTTRPPPKKKGKKKVGGDDESDDE